MVAINPKRLYGSWDEGYALDFHTLQSSFVGYDEYGHERFDTIRSEIGELLYTLKYKSDRSAQSGIVDTLVNFLHTRWNVIPYLNGVVPVPPSRIGRPFQPVLEIARELSVKIQVPFLEDTLSKTSKTPELKDVYNFDDRFELLKDAFSVDRPLVEGKKFLLFDDLYRSGATLNAISRLLREQGGAKRIYVLALTKTRSKT